MSSPATDPTVTDRLKGSSGELVLMCDTINRGLLMYGCRHLTAAHLIALCSNLKRTRTRIGQGIPKCDVTQSYSPSRRPHLYYHCMTFWGTLRDYADTLSIYVYVI